MVTKRDKKLARQLRRLRKKKKFTQEEVAEKAGVTSKYVQYLEASKRIPSLKLIYRLADALGVKVRDLFSS